jgi:hypothetical protein
VRNAFSGIPEGTASPPVQGETEVRTRPLGEHDGNGLPSEGNRFVLRDDEHGFASDRHSSELSDRDLATGGFANPGRVRPGDHSISAEPPTRHDTTGEHRVGPTR